MLVTSSRPSSIFISVLCSVSTRPRGRSGSGELRQGFLAGCSSVGAGGSGRFLEASSSGGGLGSGFGGAAASKCLSGALELGEGALTSREARARLLVGEAIMLGMDWLWGGRSGRRSVAWQERRVDRVVVRAPSAAAGGPRDIPMGTRYQANCRFKQWSEWRRGVNLKAENKEQQPEVGSGT